MAPKNLYNCCSSNFWLDVSNFNDGVTIIGFLKPEIILKPEGYNHIYYLYPQQGWFNRKGNGVYVPDSKFNMIYCQRDVAMDYDTSSV